MNHSILAPSSAHQWRWCPGSVPLSQGIADEDTDASREGTAAHWVSEQSLTSFVKTEGVVMPSDLLGRQAPNGVIITEDIVDGAKTYVNEILAICQANGLLQQLKIEQRVSCPMIHEQCWGTPDARAWDEANRTLWLWDFKFGHGRVSAFENWQLMTYAAGILHELKDNPLQMDGTRVVMTIVQPRCYDGQGPIDTWDIRAVDLRGYVNQLHHAAHKAMAPVSQCITGTHCKHCKGAHLCTALLNATANVIDTIDMSIPTTSTDAALGYELEQLQRAELLLKARREAKELEMEQRIRNGAMIPGWALEQSYSKRQWLAPQEEVITMGLLMGVNLMDEPKLLTPAKADAVCKKFKVDPAVISPYYGTVPTGMKLVFDDGRKAKQIFSNRSI